MSSLSRRLVARALGDERAALVQLAVLTVVLAVLTSLFGPQVVPPVTLVLPLIAGALLLDHRRMRVLLALAAAATVVHVLRFQIGEIRLASLLVLVTVGALSYEITRGRARVGVSGPRGSVMLAELPGAPPRATRRARRRSGPRPPAATPGLERLPCRRSRSRARRAEDQGGERAGEQQRARWRLRRRLPGVPASTPLPLTSTRATSSAAQFLAASNDYLTRQDWEEGFATAVHVAVDLRTGRCTVASAGHPPAAKFDAGSGRWSLSQAEGPLPGVIPGVGFDLECGHLRPGDALLLYTDGLVEVPGRDLSVGIDRLLGEAERLVPGGFAGSVDALVDAVAPGGGDDRALFLLWRSV